MVSRTALTIFCAAMALSPAALAGDADPIGELAGARAAEGDGAVRIAADRAGRPACFVRETGDSHHLDIGIAADGAFARLEAPDSDAGAPPPAPPVRVYAGDQQIVDDKATDRFTALKSFAGPARFTRFSDPERGFIVLAEGDAAAFLDVVAAARERFLVVQSAQPGGGLDYVAVYEFTGATATALVRCADAHVTPAAAPPRLPQLAPALPSPLW